MRGLIAAASWRRLRQSDSQGVPCCSKDSARRCMPSDTCAASAAGAAGAAGAQRGPTARARPAVAAPRVRRGAAAPAQPAGQQRGVDGAEVVLLRPDDAAS